MPVLGQVQLHAIRALPPARIGQSVVQSVEDDTFLVSGGISSPEDVPIPRPTLLILANIADRGAVVPIVALQDKASGLKADICMCNMLAMINSRLLRAYMAIDERARSLCFAVKYWAKRRSVNDPYRGSLSSYAWVLLTVHYLQTCEPPVLPCLQALRGKPWSDEPAKMRVMTHDGRHFDCAYYDDAEALKAANDATLADAGARHDHEIEQRVAKAHVASAKVARAEQKRAAKIDGERQALREKMAAAAERRAAALRVVVDKAATEERLAAAKARKAALAQDASAAE